MSPVSAAAIDLDIVEIPRLVFLEQALGHVLRKRGAAHENE
jgi:hypothetical protein